VLHDAFDPHRVTFTPTLSAFHLLSTLAASTANSHSAVFDARGAAYFARHFLSHAQLLACDLTEGSAARWPEVPCQAARARGKWLSNKT